MALVPGFVPQSSALVDGVRTAVARADTPEFLWSYVFHLLDRHCEIDADDGMYEALCAIFFRLAAEPDAHERAIDAARALLL